MGRIKDFALEIAEAVTGPDSDFFAVMGAMAEGRLQLGAVAPSGRILPADAGMDDPLLSLVFDHGYGLVARVGGSGWKTVRGDAPAATPTILPSGFDTFAADGGGATLRVYAMPSDEPTDIALSAELVSAIIDEIAPFGANA